MFAFHNSIDIKSYMCCSINQRILILTHVYNKIKHNYFSHILLSVYIYCPWEMYIEWYSIWWFRWLFLMAISEKLWFWDRINVTNSISRIVEIMYSVESSAASCKRIITLWLSGLIRTSHYAGVPGSNLEHRGRVWSGG